MESITKTKKRLIQELEATHQRISELEQSEQLLGAIFTSLPIGMCIVQDNRFQFVSPQFQQISGRSEDELIDTDALELIYHEDRHTARENTIKMLKGEPSSPHEYRVVGKNGEIRWIMVTVAPVQYHGRRATLGHFMDITERKQDRERIEHLNLTLSAIRNVNQLITKEKDRDRLLKGICHNLTATRGYHHAWVALLEESGKLETHTEAGLGEDFLPMIEQLKRGEMPHCTQQALEQSAVVVTEAPDSTCTDCPLSQAFAAGIGTLAVRVEYEEKVYGLLSASIPTAFITDEEITLFQEVASDIAFALHNIGLEEARQQAEEALRFSDTAFKSIHESVIATDTEYAITHWNEISEQIYGIKASEAIGRKLMDVIEIVESYPGENAGRFKTLETMGYYQEEQLHRTKHGEVWVDVNIQAIEGSGKRYGWVTLATAITQRKQAEESLKRSEGKYRELICTSIDGIVSINPQMRITIWNQGAERIFGYTEKEMLGQSLMKIIPERYREAMTKGFALFNKNGTGVGTTPAIELIGLRKDGTEVPAELSLSSRKTSESYIATAIIRDITQRKQMEEVLKESEEFNSSLMENAPNPIEVINPDTSIRYVNPAFEKLTGFSLAEAVGTKTPYPWWPEESRKEISKAQEKDMILSGTKDEVLIQKKNGERRWIALSSAPISYNGKLKYLLANWLDITEHKQAEEALRQSEERFSKAFRANPDMAIISTLRDGIFIEINDSATRIIGYTREEAIGHSSAELGIWAKAEERARIVQILKESGRVRNEEVDLRIKSGEIRLFLLSAELINIGDEPCMLSVTTDITERRKAEEKLRQIDRMKSEFLANISHELRTPLQSISGFTRLILRGEVPDPETQQEFLQIIDTESQHLGNLIDSLLDMSRLESGKFQINKRLLPIRDAITDAVKSFHSLARDKDIALSEDIPAKLPEIEADGERLRQVVINLLSNAIKFSDPGGNITVKAESRNGELLFQVTDQGIGIPEEAMPHLFERFYRAEDKLARGGAGLGLYISKQIIEAHGGRIQAESKAGEGSTFSFTLPLNGKGEDEHG